MSDTETSELKLAKLRFFRDMVESERLKIYKIFGVLPDDYSDTLTHGIELRLFNALRVILQLPDTKLENAIIRAEEAEEKIENALTVASETSKSWKHQCTRIMGALGFDFGDPDFMMPDEINKLEDSEKKVSELLVAIAPMVDFADRYDDLRSGWPSAPDSISVVDHINLGHCRVASKARRSIK